MAEHSLIQTAEEVEELGQRLRRERVIAVDTEADSFFHYFDKLCLIQIAFKDEIFLVDPLALPPQGLAPLAPVFADPNIRKLFHAADYDLYVLQRYGSFAVRNLFDTMISAQLLGYRSVGLAALVEKHYGVQLSKDQQRTDWSRRPLREQQLEYAASDVRYLVDLATLLEKELKSAKRLTWAEAEFRSLEGKVWPEREFDPDGYLRIKGARQLSPLGRNVLRELFLMRDKRAREKDRPPFKVLGNGTLLDLAEDPPRTKRALANHRGITDLVVRRFGGDILEAITRGVEAPEDSGQAAKPAPTNRRRLDRRAEHRLERLKSWRATRSKELDLDPGVFCANAALEEIAAARPRNLDDLQKLDHVKSWWIEGFGEEVLSLESQAEKEPRAQQPQSSSGAGSGERSQQPRRRGRRSRDRRNKPAPS